MFRAAHAFLLISRDEARVYTATRMSRAIPVQLVAPITAIRCQIVGFSSTASSARIKISVGMHITSSIKRLSRMSIQPAK